MIDKRIRDYIEQCINNGEAANIVISGYTCSGKTTLTKEIKDEYQDKVNVTVVHQDDYYKDLKDIPRSNKGVLADHIMAFHTGEFIKDIRTLLDKGEVRIPVYDINTNTRISKNKLIIKGKINIFEGLHAVEALKYKIEKSLSIYIDTDINTCLSRRIQRDYNDYNIDEDTVRYYWNSCIEPVQTSFVLPQRKQADILVNYIKGEINMTIRELYDKLLSAKRASDFFGDIDSEDSLKKKFRDYSKIVHPDAVKDSKDKYIAIEAFQILNRLCDEGKHELEAGIYGIVDPIQLYKTQSPLFELTIKRKNYAFYENVFEGEVANVYRGICEGELIYMKLCSDPEDNELLEKEYDVLSKNRHQLLPYVEEKLKVNDCTALIMREVTGITMVELLEQYTKGVPAEHVMWMLERLLNVVGWLHSNKIVHGNIKPENIIIDKDTHKVTILGLAFSIPEADSKDAHYAIVNDYFTAPEVTKDAVVTPNSDIYSIGKIAVKLLGGNVINNGMPLNVDVKVREFIRKLCNDDIKNRPGDAWRLWDELIKLRTEVYGKRRFLVLE